MLQIITPIRPLDSFGRGAFGAPRSGGSSPSHRGIDFAAATGATLLSPIIGRVTKLGYAYADDLHYRYVEITDGELLRHRFFYVQPEIGEGELVNEGTPIGTVQAIAAKYNTALKRMTNHVHYEIMDGHGNYLDPAAVAAGVA